MGNDDRVERRSRLRFLNNRITGSFEYFHKVVSDLLAFRKLNSLMEVSTIADNIGATQSTGYEFSLNTVNLTGPFKWNTTLNISSYNDRWKERNPDVVLAPYEKKMHLSGLSMDAYPTVFCK